MKIEMLESYWNSIPVDTAISYAELMQLWGKTERDVRHILHELSCYDNGDNYILIRSARNKCGFYRTDDPDTISEYREECLNKGRSIFAPVHKINRVLNNCDKTQYSFVNNIQILRQSRGFTQSEICGYMRQYGNALDTSMLSKMENGMCLPTPAQVSTLAKILECRPSEIVNFEIIKGELK